MSRVYGRALREAFELIRQEGHNLFTPGIAEKLPKLPGWSAMGLPAEGLSQVPAVTVLEALRAMAHLQTPTEASGAPRLVATLPTESVAALVTRDVVRDLLRQATRELLVVGFTITDAEFRDLLIRRAKAGVAVTVVGERRHSGAYDLWRDWPVGATPLVALENVQPDVGQPRIMHGKVLVADRQVALIGSANFTSSGLGGNIEIGVRVEGTAAADVCRLIEQLRGEGWLVAVSGAS